MTTVTTSVLRQTGVVFDGFSLRWVDVADDVRLRVRVGGHGPPIVLLHGHPRTHTTWHRLAPLLLAAGRTVICPDLRGYGRSTAPAPLPDHSQASKRAMAADVAALMTHLGHPRFAVLGHDRGAYVAHRLAMDHPKVVTYLVVLDGVPIGEALARAGVGFATAWWHWFFYARPHLPERAIAADPEAWYRLGPQLAERMGSESHEDLRAAVHDPDVVRAMLEDYRAGLGVDRAADDADTAAGRRAACPTLVLWATDDDLPDLYGDPLEVWRAHAEDLRGHAIASGHHIGEDNPAALVAALTGFLPPTTTG